MKVVVGVVDYEAGNLRSVETALRHLGVQYTVSAEPEVLIKTDRLVFPGVGDSSAAMRVLRSKGLDRCIREFYASGKPLLGICLGSQIVLEASEEGNAVCLGIVKGTAKLFPRTPGLKVPHMGWNQVYHRGRHKVFHGIPDGASFYFVHSYYPCPTEQSAEVADTEYGIRFTSGLSLNNLVAFQFHPEKSGSWGLKVLENFLKL